MTGELTAAGRDPVIALVVAVYSLVADPPVGAADLAARDLDGGAA